MPRLLFLALLLALPPTLAPAAARCGNEVESSLFRLSDAELEGLFRSTFGIRPSDRRITFLVDVPRAGQPLTSDWRDRHALATDWSTRLASQLRGISTELILFPLSDGNNADLPSHGWRHSPGSPIPTSVAGFTAPADVALADALARTNIAIGLTTNSCTAPLKTLARQLGFRGASLPSFTREMVPSLRVPVAEIRRRCEALRDLLRQSRGASFVFETDNGRRHELTLDLRHRSPHVSAGDIRADRVVANLPPGETYIVPYEGEIPGIPSRSRGVLPVQWGNEVVLYRIVNNRAIEVLSQGRESARERARLVRDPAYGNIAEMGLGVLAALGVEALPAELRYLLLNEKLGLHIAFGRSEHFGGRVGPAQFVGPAVHEDHVYLPEMQPRIRVVSVMLHVAGRGSVPLILDDRYVDAIFAD